MDLRTWQEAGIRAGSYSARHRGRSPFSPLRPAPIAIGSLSTAAIAAFAFAAPGFLHGSSAATPLLDGTPNRIAPLAPGPGADGAPGFVSVTAPTSSAAPSAAAPATPTSTATSSAGTTAGPGPDSRPTPLTVPSTTVSTTSPWPTQPPSGQSPAPTSGPTSAPTSGPTSGPTPTTPPTTPTTPTTPPTSAPTSSPTGSGGFNNAAAVSSALSEIGSARSDQGVGTLNVDSLLASVAHLHTVDMARTGDFSHIGSDGSDPYSRAARLGCFTLTQELIAHGRPGDDVIRALLRDPSSRRALLSHWNTTIGVSAQLDPSTGDVYWTIELGWG